MRFGKPYLHFLIRFFGAFCLLFYGTEAVIGLSSPENHYNALVARYFDFISPLRYALLQSAKIALGWFGYHPFWQDQFTLRLPGGGGVRMVYSCIGYGVMSFWAAFVIANAGSWWKKSFFIISGWLALFAINVGRIALLLVATHNGWFIPLGWDHHTWFNLAAYAMILGMIILYDKATTTSQVTTK